MPGGTHGKANSNKGGNGKNTNSNAGGNSGKPNNGDTNNGNGGSAGGGNTKAPYDYGGSFLYYYHADHLGSSSYITDSNAKLYEHIQYIPFGETWVQEAANTLQRVPYRFTGKELDEETGLYYFGARYYDPRTSVWVSPDPILEKYLPTGNKEQDGNLPGLGGVYAVKNLNVYGYSHQSPIVVSDPDGNKAEVRVSGNTVYISANIYLTGAGASKIFRVSVKVIRARAKKTGPVVPFFNGQQ